MAEGLPRVHNSASQNPRGVHAIKVVGLQGAGPGQASGERAGSGVCEHGAAAAWGASWGDCGVGGIRAQAGRPKRCCRV